MAFQSLARSSLAHVCSYVDEYDLASLSSARKSFHAAASIDGLWEVHLTRRSPSLAAVASVRGDCRKVFAQLETEHPRRSMRHFAFCLDVKTRRGQRTVFSATQVLSADAEGLVQPVDLANLLRPAALSQEDRSSVSIEVSVLDKKSSLYVFPFFSGTSMSWSDAPHWRHHFVSTPVFEEEQEVIILSVNLTKEQGSDRLTARLEARTADYVKPTYYFEEAVGVHLMERHSEFSQLHDAASINNEHWLATCLLDLFQRKTRNLKTLLKFDRA